MILSYPGLFKNIPHVWFLRLYSHIKNPQHDFPKMRGGVKGCLELFRKFIRFGGGSLPLGRLSKYIYSLTQRHTVVFDEQKFKFLSSGGLKIRGYNYITISFLCFCLIMVLLAQFAGAVFSFRESCAHFSGKLRQKMVYI